MEGYKRPKKFKKELVHHQVVLQQQSLPQYFILKTRTTKIYYTEGILKNQFLKHEQ
jgi:hypothetical protein